MFNKKKKLIKTLKGQLKMSEKELNNAECEIEKFESGLKYALFQKEIKTLEEKNRELQKQIEFADLDRRRYKEENYFLKNNLDN